jgi:hypothetical protein
MFNGLGQIAPARSQFNRNSLSRYDDPWGKADDHFPFISSRS